MPDVSEPGETTAPTPSPEAEQLRALGMFHDRAITALKAVVDDLPRDHPQRANIEHLIRTADTL